MMAEAMAMWPVEEMGKNSVKPSIMAIMIACRVLISVYVVQLIYKTKKAILLTSIALLTNKLINFLTCFRLFEDGIHLNAKAQQDQNWGNGNAAGAIHFII